MDISTDDPSRQIARRLRLEREARVWSQADLAARSGVAKATISKIEREEVSPTAVILTRLAGAFNLTLAGLLVRAEAGGGLLARRGDQPVWEDPDTGYRRRQVFFRPDHPLEIVQVELPAGRSIVMPASSYALIRQAVWVTRGALVIVQGRQRSELAEGDCLGFGPPVEVAFANETAVPCTYLVALARS